MRVLSSLLTRPGTTAATALGAIVTALLLSLVVMPALPLAAQAELFVDADDPACTDDALEGAGAPATPFCSIQAAIDHLEAQTATGGTITVRAAEYDEGTISVHHGDLTIRGDDAVLRSAIIVRPTSSGAIGFHVSDPLGVCDNIIIQHLTIDGSGHFATEQGILVDDICEPITLNDLEVMNWVEEGIVFDDSSGDLATTASNNSTVSSTNVHDNGGTGIEFHESRDNALRDSQSHDNGGIGVSANLETNLTIADSDILNNGLHGIVDLDGVHTTIEGSDVSGNAGHGVQATGAHTSLDIEGNTFHGNTGAGVHLNIGLDLQSGTGTTIKENEIDGNGGYGIIALSESGLSLVDNNVHDNGSAGIFVDGGPGTVIDDSDIQGNSGAGIVAEDEVGLAITNNGISENDGDGIALARGSDPDVHDNDIGANGGAGIAADDVANLGVATNDLHGNASFGVDLSHDSATMIEGNGIHHNGRDGLTALHEIGLSVRTNDIHDNDEGGIELDSGTNTTIHANDISDNGGNPGDYGILAEQETGLSITKNVLQRNFDAPILIDSSDDTLIQRNDLTVSTDGIVLEKRLAHPLEVTVGGSAPNRNRFRGLTPGSNECDSHDDRCYLKLGHMILPPINARHNDWGTTSALEIEDLVCHNGEGGCGLTEVDSSNPEAPGDSPAVKATATPTVAPVPTATPVPQAPVGDVNCGSSVNSIDAALVLQYAAGLTDSLACGQAADVNQDGGINAIDAALILQFSAGLIDTLPPT